jgi:hypothetical protein
MRLHFIACILLILFFAWMLLNAAMQRSKDILIEGLEPDARAKAASSDTKAAPDVAMMQDQLTNLAKTAQLIKTQMIKNEKDIQTNTANIQKLEESQNETVAQMASMKSSK